MTLLARFASSQQAQAVVRKLSHQRMSGVDPSERLIVRPAVVRAACGTLSPLWPVGTHVRQCFIPVPAKPLRHRCEGEGAVAPFQFPAPISTRSIQSRYTLTRV